MNFDDNPFKRRSARLENRMMMDYTNTNECALGYFQLLPFHVVSMIFDYLPAKDLGNLILTSKQTRQLFENYLKAKSTKKRFHLTTEIHGEEISADQKSDLMMHFKEFGILMKRATCLYRTKHRLDIVVKEVFKLYNCHVYCHHDMVPKECPCLPLFGEFLHSFIRGWDYGEWKTVLDVLEDESLIRDSVQRIFACQFGEEPHLEMRVRHFYRSLFLDRFGSNRDLAFWLTRIFSKDSIFNAWILFVLYGPCNSGGVLQFSELCEAMPVLSPTEMQSRFLELAMAFDALHSYAPSKKITLSLLHCIKSQPDEWLPINFANLLITLDKNIIISYLGSRAKEGTMAELGIRFAYLAMISQKYLWRIEGLIIILQDVFKVLDTANERYQLMEHIQKAFQEETSKFHHSGQGEIYFNLMLSAATEFNKCFMKKFICQGIFKV